MTVQTCDARRLSPEDQEELRRRVVAAIDAGMSQLQAARVFGVSRRAVGVWFRSHRAMGPEALCAHRRGRNPQVLPRCTQAELLQVMLDGAPEQHGLTGALWSRRSLTRLIEDRVGRRLSPSTVTKYLTRWEIVPPMPAGVPGAHMPAPPRDLNRSYAGDQAVWFDWTRPVPKFVDDELLPLPGSVAAGPRPGVIGPAPAFLEALTIQSARGDLLFWLAAEPFRPSDLIEFGQRLTRGGSYPVLLFVRSWPDEESAVLHAWAADPGPRVRLTSG